MAPRALLATAALAAVLLGCAGDPDGPPLESGPEPDVVQDDVAEDGDEPAEQPPADPTPPDDTDPPPDLEPDDGEVLDPDDAADEFPEPPEPAAAYAQSSEEVYPNAKALAAAIAQAVTTYDRDQDLLDAIADIDLGRAEAEMLAEQAAVLHHDDHWSRGRAVYAQLGGVTAKDISVMVVTEQTLGGPDGIRTETRTLDVRLTDIDGHWEFSELSDAGGEDPQPKQDLTEEAERVLRNDRIELPDSARWDILSGHTDPALLELMARAADEYRFGVVTLHSGHPTNVFGTERISDHTRGLAVDIYAVEGTAVIDDRAEDSATHRFVQWLYDQPEVRQIGSPWALDGFGGRSFTDIVHQDHLHIAVRATR